MRNIDSEYQDFLNESMQEASDKDDGMGVVFVVAGREYSGVPSPLTVETSPQTGMAQVRKTAWAIMIPLPARVEDFPKGTQITDNRGRAYKVWRAEEKRMCLEIFVIDNNR